VIITLCMAGAGAKKVIDAGWLGGQLFTSPKYQRRDILYPNDINNNPTAGAATTSKNLLKSTLVKIFQTDPAALVVFIGHSFGGRVAAKLLREDGDDPAFQAAVPPDQIVFIVTGNPERKYNGACNIPGSLIVAGYGGNGVPLDTDYRWIDVARQYDFFADHPNNRSNWVALGNIGKGIAVHTDYNGVYLGDPDNLWKNEGRISYVLSPTFPMPATQNKSGMTRKIREDRLLRPGAEKAYSRPWKPPTPTVVKVAPRVGFSATVNKEIAVPAPPLWTPSFG
jgi:3'-(hydroxy)phthioceranyl-2'-palmitoyl(stearoyl)-2-O-sulfo-trehalose (hydroxy)phthioceranyltransferase